ncbi:MAG: transglutaminase-like domain-containing protein [Cyanobacteriota bacterium]|nr:transglutaminase-like domain-containing protein [Cyanobacteriota bacterium]
MKTPVFLLGLALLFWGWQTGLWIFALPIALIIEYSHFTDSRWDLGDEEFQRVSNLSLVILLVLAVYLGIFTRSIYFVYNIIEWLPVIFFPILAAQLYSSSDRFNLRTLFFFLNNSKIAPKLPPFNLDLTHPYFALCLLSASAANPENISFYFGLVLLGGLGLWFWRSDRGAEPVSPRFSPIIWIGLLLLAGGLGFVGHIQLHRLHLTLEDMVYEYVSGSYALGSDPYKKTTSMGDMGVLKMSNEIVFRVEAQPGKTPPTLLRESTYNKYFSSMWVAVNSDFQPIKPENEGTKWLFQTAPENYSEIAIYENLHEGKGLLKIADGTFEINGLPALSLEKNPYGTVKVEGKAGLSSYQLRFAPGLEADIPPTEADLQIPESERATLEEIVKELELQGKPPEEILQRVFAFFENNFDYSLELLAAEAEKTALSTFLLQNRVGHCEYFASATTLLLRAAGIPARYAVGFSVSEYSSLEKKYVVRGRDAHAWTLAYIDGRWRDFDTTPEIWISMEDAAASKLGIIGDIWSWLVFQFSQWFAGIKQSKLLRYWWWLALIFLLLFLREFGPKRKILLVKSQDERPEAIAPSFQRGRDSEFHLIEKALSESGFGRLPSESLKEWTDRLKESFQDKLSDSDLIKELPGIIDLHYRYRFDPHGISSRDRDLLKYSIQSWLKRYKQLIINN